MQDPARAAWQVKPRERAPIESLDSLAKFQRTVASSFRRTYGFEPRTGQLARTLIVRRACPRLVARSMRLRWKIIMGLMAAGAVGALLYYWPERGDEQRAVEETRRALRRQGFRTDLSEFNFFTSAALQEREAALTKVGPLNSPNRRMGSLRDILGQALLPDLMPAVGSDGAIPVWKQLRFSSVTGMEHNIRSARFSSDDLWPWSALREVFDSERESLDAACLATLSGPIGFNLDASRGHALLLPHLVALKTLAQTFSRRAILELHDGNQDAAWTNVLATTRLVSAWIPEPTETSLLVRIACATIAFESIWQVLQADGWSEDRLVELQREWESVDFFSGLPEMAAYARARAVATIQLERQQPPMGFTLGLKEVVRAPRYAWAAFVEQRRQVRYRHHGSYEDEKGLLLHYRDREMQLERARRSPTWAEMQELPGVTNMVPFKSRHQSAGLSLLNLRQTALRMQMYHSPGEGQSLLGRTANAEARRRLIVTAIALERYRGRHGWYPKALSELAPELLENPPIDFMDGQPLRYRLTDDGHFVIYSVGLDGVDHGGITPQPQPRGIPEESRFGFGVRPGADLVWPRPASAIEIQTQAE
jgi:hypothetical protein